MSLKLLMMGTGEFAVPTFRALFDSHHQMLGLVTQPDRVGRGHHHHVNPMKALAESRGIPVFQPDRASRPESLARLEAFGADLFVVAAYGQILSAKLLALPRLGAINVHASLLPKYRGAAPINHAIWQGETTTGITIFQIEPALDAGPIWGQVSLPIGPRETAGELEARLADAAPALTLQVIDEIEQGLRRPVPQDHGRATLAAKLTKQAGMIDWTQPLKQIDRHIRAMQPWPQPYTFLHVPEKPPIRVLILAVEVPETNSVDIQESATRGKELRPGDICTPLRDSFWVRGGDGMIRVLQIQPAGKRVMSAEEFLRGHPLPPGSWLGLEQSSQPTGTD